jgi:hypothetical protein
VHVTLRARLRSLRRQEVVRTVLGALRDSNAERFRVAHYSVQEAAARADSFLGSAKGLVGQH